MIMVWINKGEKAKFVNENTVEVNNKSQPKILVATGASSTAPNIPR